MINSNVHEDCIHYRACERLFSLALQRGCYVDMECNETKCPFYLTSNLLLPIGDYELPLSWILGKPHMRQGYKVGFCHEKGKNSFVLLENREVGSRHHFIYERKTKNLVECPECGSMALVKEVNCGGEVVKYMVECTGSHFSRLYATPKEAITAWNMGKYISFNPKLRQKGGVTIWL